MSFRARRSPFFKGQGSDVPPPEAPSSASWETIAPSILPAWQKAALYAVAVLAPSVFNDPFILTQPEAVSVDKWYTQDVASVSRKPRNPALRLSAFAEDPTPVAAVETITPDKWLLTYPDSARAVKRKPHLGQHTFDDPFILTQAEATTPDRYQIRYPDTTRGLKRKPHLTPSIFDDPFILTQAEATTPDRYRIQYPDSARGLKRKPHLVPAIFDDPFALTQPEGNPDRWQIRYPDSIRGFKRKPHLAPSVFDDPFILTQPEATSIDRWRIVHPDRIDRALRFPALIPATFFDETPIAAPGDLGHIGWYSPLSEPVRSKAPFLRANQQALILDPYSLTQPEATTIDRWYAQLSEPVRIKRWLRALLPAEFLPPQVDVPRVPLVTFPDFIFITPNYVALVPATFFDETPVIPPVDLGHIGWYSPLSPPPGPRPMYFVLYRDAYHFDPYPIPAVTITPGISPRRTFYPMENRIFYVAENRVFVIRKEPPDDVSDE